MFNWLSPFLISQEEVCKTRETIVQVKAYHDTTKAELEELNGKQWAPKLTPDLSHKHGIDTTYCHIDKYNFSPGVTADLKNSVILHRENNRWLSFDNGEFRIPAHLLSML